MAISKEVRIGLLVAAAITIFFAGFYFLKGANLFSNNKTYYCYYNAIDGLQPSSVIQIRGMNVGRVSGMELAGERGVKVILEIKKNTDIPEGTVASLAASDLLGTKVIKLEMGDGPAMAAPGTELKSTKDGNVVDKVSGQLTPRLEELKGTIIALNSTLNNINLLLDEDNRKAISHTLASLKTTTENLARESGQLSGIMKNANSISANLAKNNDTINRVLSNLNKVTGQLADAPLQQTIANLEKTGAELKSIMKKINNGEGTMGKLVNDKEAYTNLNELLKSVTNLSNDLKAHPSRYINVSVFGGKKKD